MIKNKLLERKQELKTHLKNELLKDFKFYQSRYNCNLTEEILESSKKDFDKWVVKQLYPAIVQKEGNYSKRSPYLYYIVNQYLQVISELIEYNKTEVSMHK
ncbi:MAG: hypothetical protein IJ458_00365 [Clostridia bacterium]|nr:hypothetical protein [Clostridia bacterium]